MHIHIYNQKSSNILTAKNAHTAPPPHPHHAPRPRSPCPPPPAPRQEEVKKWKKGNFEEWKKGKRKGGEKGRKKRLKEKKKLKWSILQLGMCSPQYLQITDSLGPSRSEIQMIVKPQSGKVKGG